MDEEKRPAPAPAETAAATETTGKQHRETRRLAAVLLFAFALVLLFAAYKLFTVRAGGRLYFCAGEADIRSAEISCEEFDRLSAKRADLPIRWSVPVGGERFDSFSEELTLSALPQDEVEHLRYFPNLKRVDASACGDVSALDYAVRRFPTVRFVWSLPSSDGPVDGGAESLTVRGLPLEELEALLPRLTRLKEVDLRQSALSDPEKDAFAAAHDGELTVLLDVPLWGEQIPWDTETLRPVSVGEGGEEELTAALARLVKLKKLDLRDCELRPAELQRILAVCGELETDYVIRLCGRTFTPEDDQIDISGTPVEDLDEIRAAVSLMPRLKKVVMSDCGVPDAVMDALDQEYEDIRFVWTVYFSIYSLRTDAAFFCAADVPELNYDAPLLTDAQLYPVRYCRDMIALDLGHMWIEDLSFLYNMPHLQYLILVGGRFHDITPIGSLEDLKYLEIFQTNPWDISPLLNCKKLEQLNLCYCFGFDLSPLKEMTQLKRLWYAGLGPDRGWALVQALPDTQVYCPYYDPEGSTGGGWREDEAYYEMRDVFAMYYQPGGTGMNG